MRIYRFLALPLLALLTVVLMPLSALAQDDEPERIFLRFNGAKRAVTALEKASPHFEKVVLKDGSVALAGTAEMDAVFSSCRDDVGVSAEEERKCRLQAARRIFVEQVLEVSLEKQSKRRYEVAIAVWAPESNSKVYADIIEIEAKTQDAAARDGMNQIALSYMCWRGSEKACLPTLGDNSDNGDGNSNGNNGHNGNNGNNGHNGNNGDSGNTGHDGNTGHHAGNDTDRGGLTSLEVREVLAANIGQLAACRGTESGTINIAFVVGRGGAVKNVEIATKRFRSTRTGTCMAGVVQDMKFRATGKEIRVTLPIPMGSLGGN